MIRAGRSNKSERASIISSTAMILDEAVAQKSSSNLSIDELEPLEFSWQHLTASVEEKTRREILCNVSGSAHSSHMLAVLGNQKCGKSLLLRTLGGQHTTNVKVTGYWQINKKRISPKMRSIISYYPTDNFFFGTLTIAEHVMYQAQFRLHPSLSSNAINDAVTSVLSQLNLYHCADEIIGIPGRLKCTSVKNRRKLTLAAELLENTRVLLCDELLSGLSQADSLEVAKVLQKLHSMGHVIVCTLSQPSSEVYSLFDDILLLSKGKVTFMGKASEALEFFDSLCYPCPEHHNPADHFLKFLYHYENITFSKSIALVDIFQEYSSSHYKEKYIDTTLCIPKLSIDLQGCVIHARERNGHCINSSYWHEFWALLHRSNLCARREPLLTTIPLHTFLATSSVFLLLFIGKMTHLSKMYTLNSLLFLWLLTTSTFAMFSSMTVLHSDLPVLRQEAKHKLYPLCSYYLGRCIAEFSVTIFLPVITMSIFYWGTGLNYNVLIFLVCLSVCFLASHVSCAFGHMMACFFKTPSTMYIVTTAVFSVFVIYGGYIIHSSSMPNELFWLKYVSWFWYSYEVLMVNQWSTLEKLCDNCSVTSGAEVLLKFGFVEDNLVWDVYILLAFLLTYRLLSFGLLFYRLNKDSFKRREVHCTCLNL